MNPKISVIVPIYNSQQYLEECLDSIIGQTLHELEIICIDDGSTDSSPSVLSKYGAADNRIRIITKENAGYGSAINDGISAASGEYIAIVESDDFIKPDMYKRLYETAVRFGMPDIVKCDFCRFWGEGNDRSFERVALTKKDAYYSRLNSPSQDCGMLRTNGINPPGIYKASFIYANKIKLNETPGASYQDNGLWFQLFMFGKSAIFVKEPLYMVRRDNPNSSVKSKNKVYTICEEYDFIRNLILENNPPCPHALEMCAVQRFGNYIWTIRRIAPEFRREFIWKFQKDFQALEKSGELSPFFFTPQQWNTLREIIEDPDRYYFTKWHDNEKISALKKELKQSKKREKALRASTTFRIGKAIVRIPQFIRRCLHSTGIPHQQDTSTTSFKSETAAPENSSPAKSTDPVDRLLCKWYKEKTGETLDLTNPVTFNQKIQWLKINDATPQKSQLTDKFLVRSWVSSLIGKDYLIPLLGAWESPSDIPFNKLKPPFVLKMNESSGHNLLIKKQSDLNINTAKEMIAGWFSSNYALTAGYELHYEKIKPRIIAEEYLYEGPDGLTDYRFFCFDGKPYAIWVDVGSGTKKHRRDVYNLNWELQPLLVNYDNLTEHKKRPEKLNEMIAIAEKLSQGFSHVRVDLYYIQNRIYFGEMTFTSQSGIGKWDPPEYNLIYGQQIKLPIAE